MQPVSVPARSYNAAVLERALDQAASSGEPTSIAIDAALAAAAEGPAVEIYSPGVLRFLPGSVGTQTGNRVQPIVLGGKWPYTFAITAGSLPAGGSLNTSTGRITANFSEVAAITLRVTDALGAQASAALTLSGSGAAPAPTLAALTLSNSSVLESIAQGAVVGTIQGQQPSGSTLALVDTAGNRFARAGNDLVRGVTALDFETATSHQVTIRETNASATNSPRETTLTITVANVAEQPSLGALTLSTNEIAQNVATTVNIVGATAGSVITGSVPAGMTLNSAARTITGTPTTAANNSITLTETLADSPNSGRQSTISLNVMAPTPTVSISAAVSQAEGNSGTTAFIYTVTRSSSAGAVDVPWSFAAGTTSADDFAGGIYPAGGIVSLADGALTGTISINVAGDSVVESDEIFTVSIAAPAGYALGSPSSATGTILNDDVAGPDNVLLADNGDFLTADNGDYLEAA